MMKVLVLTDHRGHSDQNSIYALLNTMFHDTRTQSIHIASRGLDQNDSFFKGKDNASLYGVKLDKSFAFTLDGAAYTRDLEVLDPTDFNLLFMRLPRPISDSMLLTIKSIWADIPIINDPHGIIATSRKDYMLNYPMLCPDMAMCKSISEVYQQLEKYPIVLKPLREYGGKGIAKITINQTVADGMTYDTSDYLSQIENVLIQDGMIAMKFLKNVKNGDKRILVADGEILAGSLRLPAKGQWLCNVAQGGTSVTTTITAAEQKIVEEISPALKKLGVILYGLDTLEDDSGQRILSEINTLSIGGFPQAEKQTGKPILQMTIDKIYNYVQQYH